MAFGVCFSQKNNTAPSEAGRASRVGVFLSLKLPTDIPDVPSGVFSFKSKT
jgi:hypothetical protein